MANINGAEEEADLKISPMLSDLADNDEEAVDITDNYEEAVDTGSSNLKFFRKLKDYPVVARASKLFDHVSNMANTTGSISAGVTIITKTQFSTP